MNDLFDMPVYLLQSCIHTLTSERACMSQQVCTMHLFTMQGDRQGCTRQCRVPWQTHSSFLHAPLWGKGLQHS